uniref:Uncharacterized protein n=1 Tax=Trieres chinensis TaxID=1514140 RepID=A0A7S1ZLN9_TRICV|mmetsp:Transcript_28405/g.58111  ORF Transcript_28405/g.58111 Transcript_28405/m.58111 type:complete len:102 (+) Transcript_28405:73-378(+)
MYAIHINSKGVSGAPLTAVHPPIQRKIVINVVEVVATPQFRLLLNLLRLLSPMNPLDLSVHQILWPKMRLVPVMRNVNLENAREMAYVSDGVKNYFQNAMQ